jgi:hypothetical protein
MSYSTTVPDEVQPMNHFQSIQGPESNIIYKLCVYMTSDVSLNYNNLVFLYIQLSASAAILLGFHLPGQPWCDLKLQDLS